VDASGAIASCSTTLNCLLWALLSRHAMTDRAPRPDFTLQLLGSLVRQYRKQRGLTQRALAAKMGMHHRYISKIERGQHNIAVLLLVRLAHALEIPGVRLLPRQDTQMPRDPSISCDVDISTEPRTIPSGDTRVPGPDESTILLPILGATIRHYRQQAGLSQALLATRTRLSHTYINEIEQGHRNLSVLSLVRIADALGCSVDPLLAPLETSQRSSVPLST
jgi:transcriptional regulator with XRE-family HTH domain